MPRSIPATVAAKRAQLPKEFDTLVGTNAEGPNCFNLVLRYHGLTDTAETTESWTFAEALRDGFRPLSKGEVLEPGDVLTLWQQFLSLPGVLTFIQSAAGAVTNQVRHGAIYLGDDWVFEKPGIESKYGPFRVVSVEDSFSYYWTNTSFPSGFITRPEEVALYDNKELPPTVLAFRRLGSSTTRSSSLAR